MQWDIGKPNPRQIEFFKARARFIAYGGARGGGKSWAVRKKAAGLALSYPGAGILIVRRTFPELRENHILPMTADLAGIARYRDADKSFTFPGGSRIVFGYCSSESDVLQYQGQEYDVIFMDEATQFTEFQFTTLTACLRGANDFPKRFYLTCNPGGVGHAWVKRLFIDRRYKKTEHPEDYVFIAANVYDNHALMEHDPDYVRMLENLPEEQRRAWLLGQWDIFEGQYFAEFDRNVHVCRPHGIPAHWRRYVTLDYGMDMLAALWVAVDEQGRAVVYRELYEGRDNGKGENGQGHIISAAARRLLEANGGDEVQAWLAPPDLWNRRQDTGKSAAELFLENGVPLTKTGNSRVAGWLAVREFLAPGPGGQARGGEAARAQARDRARRFCVQNRVENEEARGGEATRAQARDRARRFCVQNRVEDEEARGGEATRAQARDRVRRFCVQNRVEDEEARGGEATRAQARDRVRRFCVQNRVEDEEARGGEAAQTLRLRTSGPALCSETEAEAPQASGPALPRLRIFDTCANLIRTLPALRHDERKPEDAAVTPHELTHAPDALRGFCTYWSTAAHAPEAAVHDILRDDFNMKKPTAGPLGQGGKYRVI